MGLHMTHIFGSRHDRTRRGRGSVGALLVALVALLLTLTARPAHGQQVQYLYDDLGRLVGVVDSSGDSASYVYDAVGNLTAILRNSAPVTILSFSPQSGPVGTTVTIGGLGFSEIAANNTVTFNGTTAAVVSATTTQIVATVPAGASTGAIAVTSPLGSATSTLPFTVTSGGGSGAPLISGFTPSIGVAGTAVTISGANFEPVPTNNSLLFNTTFASLTNATATELTAPVPGGATSGRITVTTPAGTAVGATSPMRSARRRSAEHIAFAIADFVRTLRSGNSPWDRWRRQHDETAVTSEVKTGHELFFGKAGCNQCHLGGNFTDDSFHNLGVGWDRARGRFADEGRYEVTNQDSDRGAFKTPTLRDVSRHPPYMHDGSIRTLRDVVDWYNRGGEPNPYLDPRIRPLNLTKTDVDALVAFLHALDGTGYQQSQPRRFPSSAR